MPCDPPPLSIAPPSASSRPSSSSPRSPERIIDRRPVSSWMPLLVLLALAALYLGVLLLVSMQIAGP